MAAALSLDLRERVIADKPLDGDRHSHRTEAHAVPILQTLEGRFQAYLREVRTPCRTKAPR